MHRPWQRTALILLSAGLYTLLFPPWNFTSLSWVALVPFLYALHGLRPRSGLLAGLLWGVAIIWGVGIWLPSALSFYYQQPLWFGLLFALVASIFFIGIYHAGFGVCAPWVMARSHGLLRALLLAVLWVAWELAKSRVFTGDPWLLLGYSLVAHQRLIQIADLGGVYLLSFVVVLVNAALTESLIGRRPMRQRARPVLAAASVVVAVYAYGAYRLAMPLPQQPRIPIVVVQGNNDLGAQWRREFYGQGLETYLRLSYAAATRREHSLIFWPESAITFFLADEPLYRAQVARMLSAANADLIVGGPYKEALGGDEFRFYNSAFYVTEDGEISDRYDKGHLLPFAEYFPLRTVELLRRHFERVRYFTPGSGTTPLDTGFGKVATVICFEGMFPEIVGAQMRRGAGLLVNLSNDAWLGDGAGPEQHMMMVALRAVENRTWVIRSTTTGISTIIDPYGRIVQQLGAGARGVLRSEVVPLHVQTFYKRFGDAFAFACLGAMLLAGVVLALRAGLR